MNREHGMRDFEAFRRTAIRYWERGRIFYNLALVPPALFGYALTAGIVFARATYETHYLFPLSWFVVSALGANICYTFAYGLEFLFGSDDPASFWLRFGRTIAYAMGLLFAVLLALIGGRNIALIEYQESLGRGG